MSKESENKSKQGHGNRAEGEGSPKGKRILLRTFGCQMNERDSEAVKGSLIRHGYEFTDEIKKAAIVMLNTCSVRQHAEERVYAHSRIFKAIRKESPEVIIGIIGCMAQEKGDYFFKKMPNVDFVCGTGNLSQIPEIIKNIAAKRSKRILAIDHVNEARDEFEKESYRVSGVRALVNIVNGCDYKCTYCVVPKTRGIERSRRPEDIIDEIRDLKERGFSEVMLLGQNVNRYGVGLDKGMGFADLLKRIDIETGIARLRFMTSHPKDASEEMFRVMEQCRSVCEYLHLPVQSGSSKILRRMKRGHTREEYLDKIRLYKKIFPDGGLSTDTIVGFSGETDEDFEETLSLYKEARFDFSYIFKYSPRPGTPAYKLKDDVPEKVKR